ncbi:hypothetical protein [Actinomadura rubrisoli]|uniref:Uncharacterized protein n=1 Tax=Actinomadura rubrisoli TaxID=2530368 RepID=A0A4R5C4Y7_9ACTN|nr:hypothetical protein [Actinomadura rubrisoli]TDD93506.1 hypothetical protein E1298_09260 [Actinomadura rubrisoli]
MNDFLSSLGSKVAERWLNLLVLPGLLFLGVAIAGGGVLGHDHWHDIDRLRTRVNAMTTGPSAGKPGTIVLVSAATLLASAGLGLIVQALGTAIGQIWLRDPADPFSRLLVRWRCRRWAKRHSDYREAKIHHHRGQNDEGLLPSKEGLDRLRGRRDRIALIRPTRPTWSGDRMVAVDDRVRQLYGMDVAIVWPRLWLVLPGSVRTQLHNAREAFSAATKLAAWGCGYAILGVWWWPALVIGAGTWIIAWRRVRTTIETLAVLIEASVDLHGNDLAERLRVSRPGHPFGPRIGKAVQQALRRPDP